MLAIAVPQSARRWALPRKAAPVVKAIELRNGNDTGC